MDKLQVVLEFARKYHFWLLCVVAVVASLAGWMKARGTLSEEYEKGKSTIVGTFGSLEQIQMTEFPPNSTWKQQIAQLTEQEREKVAKAWQTVYDDQQNALEWPEVLGDDFVKWIRSNKPDAEIPQIWRTRYRDDVINVEFPKLVKRVDAKMEIEERNEKSPTRANAKSDEPERIYKVNWDQDSQAKVQNALKMADLGVPSSLEVRLRQEDLWVFRALLDIIRATNESAKYTSYVKRINSLSIGAEAAKSFQEGMKPGHIQHAQQASEEEQASMIPRSVLPEALDAVVAPDEGRYVDDSGNPLPSGVAQTEQFKRLPVYLKLVMNQREITGLLTHCANYPLPVEVRQLRINPGAQTQHSSQRALPSRQGASETPSPTAADRFDVTVEIHGIIYIYNPPDAAKLGQASGSLVARGGY